MGLREQIAEKLDAFLKPLDPSIALNGEQKELIIQFVLSL